MPEDTSKLTCEEFQSQIPKMIASGANTGEHPHVKACAICRELLRELETIAENARHLLFGTNKSGSDDWSEST